ncbi:heterokaryon incompatibility protein-domain-containing protein [Hypoxylon sp. FL1857]|nr:heterokaryon incompatibility protein-domain-containing protein [Hypoxylon sp. FL1857]
MEASGPYQYAPLATSNCNTSPFRILRLLPGTAESPLVGEIIHAHLDSPSQVPSYEALSYCWGDPSEVGRITIGPEYLPVARSLRAALFQLRSPDVGRDLWVDAICINQNDVDERSREVRLMHRIYHGASKVLIWLDEPSVKSRYWNPRAAFEVATRLSSLCNNRPDINIHKLGRSRKIHKRRLFRVSPFQGSDALRLLFTCPWFGRMWVIQEAICAKAATVICGQHTLDFKTLISAVEYGLRSGLLDMYRDRTFNSSTGIGASPTHISAAMAMYEFGTQPSQGSDILSFLRRFHGSQCSDPRDKLFALYGISSLDQMDALAEDFKAMGILPDYHLLSIPRPRKPEDSRVPGLPSWVPDWSVIDADTAALSYAAPEHYSASGSSRSSPQFTCSDHENLVTLSGYVLDHVTEKKIRHSTSSIPKLYINTLNLAEPVLEVMITWIIWTLEAIDWELSSQDPKPGIYINGQDLVDVYWALIIAIRDQFQTAWYADGLLSQDIRPSRVGRWLARQLDRCPRFRNSHFPYLYHAIILLTIYVRGLHRFNQYDGPITRSRSLIKTAQGYIGLAPANVKPGDLILLCQGGKKPLIARPSRNGSNTERLGLVGDVYLHGIMNGEAWNEKKCHPIILE